MSSITTALTELEERACVLLSNLFLDTELTQTHIDSMARDLHPLGLTVDHLDGLLRRDVFPALYPNLLSVAGEWSGFDNDDLIRRINDSRARGKGMLQSLSGSAAWVVLSGSVTSTWDKVKEQIEQLERDKDSKPSSSLHPQKGPLLHVLQ
ncbi:hypothetical protein QQZ08_006225 [Neonectria magnoliae]|uniref:DUF7079 domain-containing protein n=1 Tax=Neonectria magnoliae TaxID=2732573 RepID=A0ABR1I209_9HYPO